MEHPSIGSRKRWATMTDIAMGYTPRVPPSPEGISIVANTLYTKSMVPIISAKKT